MGCEGEPLLDTVHFRSRRAKLRTGLALSLTGFILALGLELSGILETYSLKTLDLLFRSTSLHPARTDVVIVTVAQPDLDFFKERGMTWPWPRQLYAPVIEFCARGGARAVIMDILFTEASSYGQEDDERFAEAMAASASVVLPLFLSRKEREPGPADQDLLKKILSV